MGNGRCVVCEVLGRGSRDFICQECGGPDKNLLFCTGCRTRTLMTPGIITVVRSHTGIDVPEGPGVTIRVSSCLSCGGISDTVRTEVYVVRRPRRLAS